MINNHTGQHPTLDTITRITTDSVRPARWPRLPGAGLPLASSRRPKAPPRRRSYCRVLKRPIGRET